MSNFLDEVNVTFTSGRGGNGSASFHREKHVPRGGPDGADGGKGGDVVLVADRNRRTLYDFRLRDHYEAENGGDARKDMTGKNGLDVVIPVPVGTVVFDNDTDDVLADLHTDGMRFIACKGGRGGLGNLHFTSSVRQSPKFAQKGAPGEVLEARLELKLIADVGLIGLPNAGKSTFLSSVSAAKPKIADYPFTTLAPNLGVVQAGENTFVIADLPGLIEGASEGTGLGHQFLRHAERNKVLLHLVDAFPIDDSDPRSNYDLIEAELESYSPELAIKPRIVALTKADVLGAELTEEVKASFADVEHPIHIISSVSGHGIKELTFALWEIIAKSTEESVPTRLTPVPVDRQRDDSWDIEVEDGEFIITGDRIERLVAMTDLENTDAVMYMVRRLKRIGVIDRLVDLGVEEGDTVVAGTYAFEYRDW
ncbi:MAG: GTPase ObgE [Armatimonadetes bacterium]|nr:GTPase ObgE [Armatimonadota bacterium]